MGIVTLTLCYSPGSRVLKPTSAIGGPLAIVVLQAGWVVSELAFPQSVFAPAALSTQPVLPRTHQELLILRFGPVSLILLMASCLGFFSKALKPRRKSQSGNCSESNVCEPVVVVQRQGVAKSQLPSPECHVDTMDTVDTVDTVDSASSISDGIDVRSRASSSTELFVSGASTPCGHCPPSPKNVVKLVEPGSAVETFELSDDTIYLTQHVLDTNETVLFVYKRLKPIKTRVEDPPPIPPPSYLSYPANYVSNPLKQDYNDRYYGSTTKIVRPHGMDMEGAVMIPRGQRIIPIVATIPL